jgi:hypothetical protein
MLVELGVGSSLLFLLLFRNSCYAVVFVRRTGVHIGVAVKKIQDGLEYQRDACFMCWTIALIEM